jgi:hypothetical protein
LKVKNPVILCVFAPLRYAFLCVFALLAPLRY